MSDETNTPMTRDTTPAVDALEQCGKTIDYTSIGNAITETWIGEDDVIATKAQTYCQGKKYTNADGEGVVRTSRTEKLQSDRSKWTVTYFVNKDPGSGHEDEPLDDIWSENVAQYQFPLERYLDKYEAKAIKEWERQDPDVQVEWIDAGVAMLPGKALDVAKLKMAGTNEVVRCYPQCVRTRVFSSFKENISPDLCTIDDTPEDEFIDSAADWDEEMSWLKVGFDWSQDTADNWTLVETWIGSPVADGGWNENLYGPIGTRWPFYNPDEVE